MSCEKCGLLTELYERTPQRYRDYWAMTELFVFLHDGKDHCGIQREPPTARGDE